MAITGHIIGEILINFILKIRGNTNMVPTSSDKFPLTFQYLFPFCSIFVLFF